MPKPEIILSFIEKINAKREEVTTVCMGDYDGDGKKEIIIGGGQSEKSTLMRAIKNIDMKDQNNNILELKNGYVLQTLCFDIDNDGKDEIICGNEEGELFYIDHREKMSEKVELMSFSTAISNIKILPLEAKTLIFSSSRDGSIGICKFENGKHKSNEKIPFDFEIWSLLPILNENDIILIVGGNGFLSIIEILENGVFNEKKRIEFPNLNRESNPEEYVERIYDICLIENKNNKISFACGCRSGKIYLFNLNSDLNLIKEFESGKSIYKLNYFDIDNCGSNELIAVGEIGKDNEEIGHIEIFKFESETIRSINVMTHKKRIFSVLPMRDDKKNKNYLLVSAASTSLILFEVGTIEWIKQLIYPLAFQISEKPGKFCFFLGAGISVDIFPIADKISKIIMEDSKVKPEIIKNHLKDNVTFNKYFENGETLNERIPLEAILFWYKNHYGRESMVDTVIKYYGKKDVKIPYSICIIAKLIKLKLVNYVFTVNYDTLLEQIINDINPLIKQEDYISTNICHRQAIFKLHGSVKSSKSIEGALDEVTELKGNKKQVLDFILNGHKLIFIGYSCRDLDIFPALKEIVEKHKTSCYFIDPANPNDNINEIIKLSGGGDIDSRYFQIESNLFFEFLSDNLYKARGIEI